MGFPTVVLLVILFFFNQTSGQNTSSQDLSTKCPPSSNGSDVWWTPLQVNHKHDPCSLSNHLLGDDNRRRDHKGHRLPYKASLLQAYNIMAACLACTQSPNKTTTPSAEELVILPFQPVAGEASGDSESLHDLPRWTNTTVGDDGKFNATQAVQVAISDNSIPSAIRPNAGAIAGGVIGSCVFISLIFIAFLVVRRRRLKAQIAPSAKYLVGVGPRAVYNNTSSDESLPSFEPGEWRNPAGEKAYHAATAERPYDSGFSLVASRV